MTAFDQHRNFAYSTVAVAPSPATSGMVLTLASGDGAKFPTPPFQVVVWPAGAQPLAANAEVARCTGKAGDVLTITRAQEGSAARAVVAGDQLATNVTAKWFTDLEDAVNAASTPALIDGGSPSSSPTGNLRLDFGGVS